MIMEVGLNGRFNAEIALKKLRGKRLMFVGDSLQRGQWQSFVCMVEWLIPEDKKSLKRGRFLSVFSAKVLIVLFFFLFLYGEKKDHIQHFGFYVWNRSLNFKNIK